MSNQEKKELLWRFVRGELSVSEFEAALYNSENQFEQYLGKELYLTTAANNFQDKDSTFSLKKLLRSHLEHVDPNSCRCLEIQNLDAIGMGHEGNLFQLLTPVKDYGKPLWWLSLYKCNVCSQFWMIAQEERHNDVYLLKRLREEEARAIENDNLWPKDFARFEDLLRIGAQFGHRVQFVDLFNSSLESSVSDLTAARPDITDEEVANLLNLDLETARLIKSNKNGKREKSRSISWKKVWIAIFIAALILKIVIHFKI